MRLLAILGGVARRFGKLITDTGSCEDVLWMRWVWLYFAAQSTDINPEKLAFLTITSAPNTLEQMRMRDDHTWMVRQCPQEAIFCPTERDKTLILANLMVRQVYLQFPQHHNP